MDAQVSQVAPLGRCIPPVRDRRLRRRILLALLSGGVMIGAEVGRMTSHWPPRFALQPRPLARFCQSESIRVDRVTIPVVFKCADVAALMERTVRARFAVIFFAVTSTLSSGTCASTGECDPLNGPH